jgi:hypothetical protein
VELEREGGRVREIFLKLVNYYPQVFLERTEEMPRQAPGADGESLERTGSRYAP